MTGIAQPRVILRVGFQQAFTICAVFLEESETKVALSAWWYKDTYRQEPGSARAYAHAHHHHGVLFAIICGTTFDYGADNIYCSQAGGMLSTLRQ